jgi:alpha-amylase
MMFAALRPLAAPACAVALALSAACGGGGNGPTTPTPPTPTPPGGRPALAPTYRASGRGAAGDVMVHLFEWRWADIAGECEAVLGPAGYKAVQVSPPQEHAVISHNGGFPWWQRYQPVSYSLGRSRSGTEAEFANMVGRCRAAGVDIYVDAVINHMTANASGTGSNGTAYTKYSYPGTWAQADFHPACGVSNYGDPANVQDCELVGLADLRTGAANVRQRLADYLLALARLGVAGFRIDAAKHMQPVDLDAILGIVNRALAAEGRALPYVFAEVIDYGNEGVKASDYYGLGFASGGAADISEFKVRGLSDKFANVGSQRVADLKTFSQANWGIMPSDKAVVFLENHDTARDAGFPDLSYRTPAPYRLANVYLLAQPYGYPSVLSGYAFSRGSQAGRDAGPPSDGAGNTTPVSCAASIEAAAAAGTGWVCEHRDPAIRRMVKFRRDVAGTELTWRWDDGQNAVAFSRGDRGFVMINRGSAAARVQAPSGLAGGAYCDVLAGGRLAAGGCAGARVDVAAGGLVDVSVPAGTALVLQAGVAGAVRRGGGRRVAAGRAPGVGRGRLGAALALLAGGAAPMAAQAPRFAVTDSSVRQGRFEAVAAGRDTIRSSYPRAAREVRFKFSLGGAENEFAPGTEHTVYLRPVGGRLVTPVYTFGDEREPAPPTPEEGASSEEGTARVTFRVDLRPVLRALGAGGTYTSPAGARITREAARHVYVTGDPEPLTGDPARLRPGSPLELTDADGDSVYTGTVAIATAYTRPRAADGRALWARSADLSRYPRLRSAQRLQDAVYRLSLEELTQLVRPDGTLRAGAKWDGVWTRDVSLAALLSLALVAPDAVRASLEAKVTADSAIIQDTGTGGSWPVSTDRVVWALAAWEVYAATGDTAWLRRAHTVTRRSAEADLHAVRDPATGLFRGESSFMDWREQSYPRWMEPADIARSQSLSTNVAHYAAHRALARMGRALGGEPARDAAGWDALADSTRAAVGRAFWQPALGHHAEYRYGRLAPSVAPRAEGLGDALAVVLGAVDPARARQVVRRTPVVWSGVPSFWPFIPGERLYHNGTVWPFVTAFGAWAGAEAGNTAAVRRGLDAATRTTALFLTNKENLVAATGHYDGTALNNDRQLWSVAGTLASTYRLLFGLRLLDDRLAFRRWSRRRTRASARLAGLRYRGAVLDVTVRGHGERARARLDGARSRARGGAGALAARTAWCRLDERRWPRDRSLSSARSRRPPTPRPARARPGGGDARVARRCRCARYVVTATAARSRTARAHPAARRGRAWPSTRCSRRDAAGDESFLSEPVRVGPDAATVTAKPAAATERAYGDTASRASRGRLRHAPPGRPAHAWTCPVRVDRAGDYEVDVRYANGSGPGEHRQQGRRPHAARGRARGRRGGDAAARHAAPGASGGTAPGSACGSPPARTRSRSPTPRATRTWTAA